MNIRDSAERAVASSKVGPDSEFEKWASQLRAELRQVEATTRELSPSLQPAPAAGTHETPQGTPKVTVPLRVVDGTDSGLDPAGLAPIFRGLPYDDSLSAGIGPRAGLTGPAAVARAGPSPATPPGNADPLQFEALPTADAVARLNTEYFVLRNSGKIYRQGVDGELNALTNQNFRTALGGRYVEIRNSRGDLQRRPAADAWLVSPGRREFIGLQYCPNDIGLKPKHLNLFTGWGEIVPAAGSCSVVLDHIREIVADGNDAKADYFLDWVADIFQNPTRKPGVCTVLRGGQGTGKSVVGAIMRRLLGPRNVLTTGDKDRILGRFNSSVVNKILLVGEEMLFAGDRATTDKLKHLITGPTIQIEVKFGDALEIDSFHRLLLTSNHHHVFQAAGEERRFVTYDVPDHRRGNAGYFSALYAVAEGRDDATAAAFMKYLLERDLSAFSPWRGQQAFSNDTALARQKLLSLSPPLTWLHEAMSECDAQQQLVARFIQIEGYRCLSLTWALDVVKCQFALV